MKKKKISRKKRGSPTNVNSQTNATPKVYKGIKFKSTIEVYMYKLFEASDIPFAYEGTKFVIIDGFTSPNISYEKFLNGKGAYKDRGSGKKYNDMVYTPDFTPPVGQPLNWVVEVKGRSMPDFSRTWKLFKKLLWVEGSKDTILYMPRTQKDCRETIKLINENTIRGTNR